ncbi:snake venom vascular endothelial growth factor toxin HF-like [Haemaphysalis longicornis]
MAREQDQVTRGLVWTALIVLCACFAVGLCRPPKTYGDPERILAREHERRVLQDAPCKFPQQRTICLNETSSKKYVPHCTLLHRCAPDTGCCATEEEHCQPKTIKNITLHFLVHGPHGGEQRTKVETLVFDNHTECECRAKYDHIR